MKRYLHLAAVYLGLREDPDFNARQEAERPDAKATALRLALAFVAGIFAFSLIAWVERLLDGGGGDLESIVRAGALKFLVAVAILAAVTGIRWAVRWYERSSEDS